MYFLDTSAVLELLYGTEKGEIIKKLVTGKPIFISSFTSYELFLGLKEKELEKIKTFFKEVTVIDFDKKAAWKSAEIERNLKKEGKLINKVDIFIAGICLIHNFVLVTCDSDFKEISGLKIERC